MPWKNPPTGTDQSAIEGSILAEVNNLYRTLNPSLKTSSLYSQ